MNLTPSDAKPAHSATFRAGSKASEFEKDEINKVFSEGAIEPDQTERVAPMVVTLKRIGPVRFCDEYRKSIAVLKRDAYSIVHMDESIDSLGIVRVF